MKLLKIQVSGVPRFKAVCEIDFLAQQRVTEDNAKSMSTIFETKDQTFVQNNVLAFIGTNASGKTTALKLIVFVCKMLNNEQLNGIDCAEIFDGFQEGQSTTIETYFYTDCIADFKGASKGVISCLTTVLSRKNGRLQIEDETLKVKSITNTTRKKTICDFVGVDTYMSHMNADDYLLDDVSIMIAFNRKIKSQIFVSDLVQQENMCDFSSFVGCPSELVALFDSTVECFNCQKDGHIVFAELKFKTKKVIHFNSFDEMDKNLSAGTIRGVKIFLEAAKVLKSGGYFVVDDLENNLNYRVVTTLIRLFRDLKMNTNGAMLIFSTHCPEILDEFERNDNVYVVQNCDGIIVEDFSSIFKRNDISKSRAYKNGFLEGESSLFNEKIFSQIKEATTEH